MSAVEHEFQVGDIGGRGSAAAILSGDTPTQGTAAVDRSADLLVRVLESEQPVALGELASVTGIPKSTASRLLSALERRGLVEQDGKRGRIRPGPAILRVAERSMLERNVVELARPSLDALAEISGETINLAVPALHGVEHLAQVDSRHFLGAGQWVGRLVEYHCTAVGKVFLAAGRAPMPTTTLTSYTEQTIIELASLGVELESVRRNGWATVIDELEEGLAAMAAPVSGARGDVVAALSISGPTLRMTPQRIEELHPLLIDEARTLSQRLGSTDEGEHAA